MKYLLFILLSLQAIALAGENPNTLRLLTYNIHAGIGVDRKFDLQRIAEVIIEVKPHVVALQEVDIKTRRSQGIDILEELAKLIEMTPIFGKSINFSGGEYGNAILTSLPVQQSETFEIPRKIEAEKRSLLSAELLFHGETIRILATHLCHKENSNRELAAEFITSRQPTNQQHAFLMGDLNALPSSQPLKILTEAGWQLPSEIEMPTVPVDKPKRQIDYILYKPKAATHLSLREMRVLEEDTASDHRALLVVFELPE